MTALKKPNFITTEDFCAGEEISDVKHEYLGGTMHALAGATHQHNRIATSALPSLRAQLRGKPRVPFNSDTQVRIEPDSPSVQVFRRKGAGGFVGEHHSGLGSPGGAL